jgi:hypothetical protein
MSLKKWFAEKWVDIGRKKKDGSYADCGRRDSSKGKYPKCVPAAKAASMSKGQIRSAVQRKRKAEKSKRRVGNKPINVSTFARKK